MGMDARAPTARLRQQIWIVRDRVRLRNVQQRARFSDVVSAAAVGQEPVVADAMEAFRQDVHQEAADELVCRECHELVPLGTLDPVVLVFERDAHRVSCDQAVIGDCDAMCVACEVRENGFGSAEWLL